MNWEKRIQEREDGRMFTNTMLMKFKKRDAETIAQARDMLLSMRGKIPPLQDIQVFENDLPEDRFAYDLLLIVTCASKKDFYEYMAHPVHVEVSKFILDVLDSAATVGRGS